MVICAKTAEPIEMLLWFWARMGPRNHVIIIIIGLLKTGDKPQPLDQAREMLRDVAMATNFWVSLGYNFGCMIASDMLLILGWIFGVKLSDKDIADFEVLRDVAMATNFGSKIAITCFV